jgi:hypothetical protein
VASELFRGCSVRHIPRLLLLLASKVYMIMNQ